MWWIYISKSYFQESYKHTIFCFDIGRRMDKLSDTRMSSPKLDRGQSIDDFGGCTVSGKG